MGAGPTLMAYHGARVASMATSPIAIAVPSGNGPIVLDMATSTISNGKILQARATGAPLPPKARCSPPHGEPTTDAEAGRDPAAARRPQGFGTWLHVRNAGERACGSADPGAARSARKSARATPAIPRCSSSISRRSGRSSIFKTDADALAAVVKALPRQAGFDEILLPGERGNRTEAARRKSGIPIPAKLWEELAAIAKAAGGQDAGYRGRFMNLRTQSAGSVAATRPPFRAEHIGSLLRPAELMARARPLRPRRDR